MQNAQKIGLSVIIPTRNRSKLLEKTLQGLCCQTNSQALLEIIIVSDGSTDLTCDMVHQFQNRLPIKYLEQPQGGVSSARNRGLRYATSPFVLLLDDDVVPSPKLIEMHNRFHNEKPESEAVLLGYVTWHPDLPVTPFMRWYGEFGALFGYSLLKDNEPASSRFFYSCNISLKRDFLMSNRAFDEMLTVFEDNELGFRLAQRGMQLFFWKGALGYHYQTFTFEESCQRLQRYQPGLNAFLATAAGRALAKRRGSLPFRVTERIVRITAPLLAPLVPIIDKDVKLPNFMYRLFYWYHGQYLSFWSRADKVLLRAR
jgi:glycosyltransferase involved in cell wall biosynthesis